MQEIRDRRRYNTRLSALIFYQKFDVFPSTFTEPLVRKYNFPRNMRRIFKFSKSIGLHNFIIYCLLIMQIIFVPHSYKAI